MAQHEQMSLSNGLKSGGEQGFRRPEGQLKMRYTSREEQEILHEEAEAMKWMVRYGHGQMGWPARSTPARKPNWNLDPPSLVARGLISRRLRVTL